MKLIPVNDRILVSRHEAEKVSMGGIVIPESAQKRPQWGDVLAVGEGRLTEKGERLPMNIKKGDVVLFSNYAGAEVTFEGDDFLVITEQDVLAIAKE